MFASVSLPRPCSPTSAIFVGLDDELHDARRVLSQGQEEDLRCALDRVLGKVEELASLLKTAIRTQTELETQLNLAKSNLQLVISNNEMLEEALKRETPYNARDVGWRRWSAREAQNHNIEKTPDSRPKSLDGAPLDESIPAVVPVNGAKPPALPQTPATGQESRFFKFRFNSGGSDTDLSDPSSLQTGTSRSPSLSPHPSHLTSPSLPSLVSNTREKEIEELQEQLERERLAHKAVDAAKTQLEAELESLSQALFEEANKMVATERMRRAETEEELKQTRLEKEALHQALKLIEDENGRLRVANASESDTRTDGSETPSKFSMELPSEPVQSGTIAPAYEVPDFVLEPAPKPSHRRIASVEEQLEDSLPVLLPDEPSPWADSVAS